jgi:putative spermidine/putrescine transport system ATP-binding protein
MTSTTAGATVELHGVTKRYGTSPPSVDSLDLQIRAGEFLTLLGPSGSGKTTTLNMIAGFIDVTEGEITMDKAPITGQPPHRRNIGMVFQNYALFPHMTVAENVGYPLKQRKVPKGKRTAAVGEALERVQLSDYAKRLPRELSGGQQQRVAVARATIFEPRLLLMDEPLGALDLKLRAALQLGFKQLHRELGITMVYVTHDQSEALVMSDRIAVYNNGRIEQIGDAVELYERPTSRFVAEFLGESNLFDGNVSHAGANSEVANGGVRLGGRRAGVTNGAPGTLAIRPERTRLDTAAPGAVDNVVRGTVRDIVYLGSLSKVVVDLEAGPTWATTLPVSSDEIPEPGQTVYLSFQTGDARVLPPHSHLGVAVEQ